MPYRDKRTRRTILRRTGGLIAVGGAGGLAGCTSGGSGDGGGGSDGGGGTGTSAGSGNSGSGKEISMVSDDSQKAVVEANKQMAKAFQEETGHSVSFEYAQGANILDLISQRLRGGNPPEIALSSTSVAGTLMNQDQLRPIDELLDEMRSSGVGSIPDSYVTTTSDGEVVQIPQHLEPYQFVIHGHLFEEAGLSIPSIDERLNADWETFTEWMTALSQNTDTPALALPYSQSSVTSITMLMMLMSNGIVVYSGTAPDDIEITLDQEPHRERAIEVVDYIQNDLLPNAIDGTSLTWADMNTGMSEGQFASTMYTPGSISTTISNGAGEEEWIDTVRGVLPPLNREREDGKRHYMSSTGYMFLKGSKNHDVALDFVRHSMTTDAYYDYMNARPLHYIPPTIELMESDTYKETNWLIERRPDALEYTKAVLDTDSGYAPSLGLGGYNQAWSQTYSQVLFGNMLQRIIIDDQDPGESIDQTSQKMREFI